MGHEQYRAQKFTIVHRFTAHINQQGRHWDSQLLASKSTSAGTATDLGCFRKSFMMGSAQPSLSGQALRLWKIHSHSGTTPIVIDFLRDCDELPWCIYSMMTVSAPLLNYMNSSYWRDLEGRLPFLSPKCPLKSWLSPIFLVESPIFLGCTVFVGYPLVNVYITMENHHF